MIKVLIPNTRIIEQHYVIDVLLGNFLGLKYEVNTYDGKDIVLSVKDSNKKLTINTDFFIKSNHTWLKQESMPNLPLKTWSPNLNELSIDLVEESIPVIYGQAGIEKNKEHWHLNLDVFGSVFFMLSRYEELITTERDQHDRFPASESIAYKEGFLERPIVNEYLEILWKCLHQLWPSLTRKKHQPKTFISCDVDQPYDCTVETIPKLLRTCVGDFVKRKKPFEAIRRVNRYLFNKMGIYKFDTNYTFDWYMDECEQAGLKATFYFIPTSIESNNGCYELTDKKIIQLMQRIDQRGYKIGLHGSYQTYRDEKKVIQQKILLEKALIKAGIKQKIKGNRQHYLRWDSAITPEILDKAGFEYDSTGSYADHAGFRYGTAHEFNMWGWQQRRMLGLKQRPLVVMECTVIDEVYMGMGSGEQAYQHIDSLKNKAKKYGGSFSLLWHNSYLKTKGNKRLFKLVLGT